MEYRGDGLLQADVGVGDLELRPVQSTDFPGTQERGPGPLVLAFANVNAKDLPAPVRSYPEGDHDGLGHDSVPDPGFALGRIEEQHGWSMVERSRSRKAPASWSRSAESREPSDLEILGSAPGALTRSSTCG